MYLPLWLIRRWRLPATPHFTLPVAVSVKRFLTPLLVFNLGIFVSFRSRLSLGRALENSHGSPFGRAVRYLQRAGRAGPIERWGAEGNPAIMSRRRPGSQDEKTQRVSTRPGLRRGDGLRRKVSRTGWKRRTRRRCGGAAR